MAKKKKLGPYLNSDRPGTPRIVRPKKRPKAKKLTMPKMNIKGTITGRVSDSKPNVTEMPSKQKKMPSREEVRAAVKAAGDKTRLQREAFERERLVGAPHGIVRARAGTGKTFTMIIGVLWAAVMWAINKFSVAAGTSYARSVFERNWTEHSFKSLGFTPTPSPQQLEVWKFIAREPARSVRYLAMGKAIVEDFEVKYASMVRTLQTLGVGLSFSTIHSLGFAACRRAYRLNSWKCVTSWKTRDLLSVLWEVDLREVEKEKWATIEAIVELVRLCKVTLAGRCDVPPTGNAIGQIGEWRGECIADEELDALALEHGIQLNGEREEIFRDVRLLLDMARENTDRIDHEDMLWLPIVNNLQIETFDLLLIDEGQDLNRCMQELCLRAGKRLILVGDEYQAIFGFAGADAESIDRMRNMLLGCRYLGPNQPGPTGYGSGPEWESQGKVGRGCEEMKLTVTRRCGKVIVQEAQAEVPEFEAHEGNCEGRIERLSYDTAYIHYGCKLVQGDKMGTAKSVPLPPGQIDMVLCRTNAPLVSVAFRMLREGRKCNIKGRDIGESFKKMVKRSEAKDVSSFLVWLEKFEKDERARVSKWKGKKEEALVRLEDSCECLRMFAGGCIELKEMYASIDSVFALRKPSQRNEPEPKPEGTLLSSIHRAKGLEAKRVFLLRPDLIPHPSAKTPSAREQETHLLYIAKTRAIETFVYVEGTRGVE